MLVSRIRRVERRGRGADGDNRKENHFSNGARWPRADDFIAMDDHGRRIRAHPFQRWKDHKWIPHRDNDMKNELERR